MQEEVSWEVSVQEEVSLAVSVREEKLEVRVVVVKGPAEVYQGLLCFPRHKF